jgi:hypothetical protein
MATTLQIEKAMKSAMEYVPANSRLGPVPDHHSASSVIAVRRCCAAWKRAFKAYTEENNLQWPSDDFWGARLAGEAYRNAMPLLVGYRGARDFVACAAHGILIGAIPKEESGQVLYAAQVALSIAQSQCRMNKLPVSRPPKQTSNAPEKSITPPLPPAKSPTRRGRNRRTPLESAA